jgi:peptidoglycan hydrolase CwlO-like protein
MAPPPAHGKPGNGGSAQARPDNPIDRFIAGVGSIPSLIAHTLVFSAFFLAAVAGWVAWDQMLLVLTTLLSLEAIYLAIFIQMAVNRQSASLKEVEADVDAIQENVEDLKENVGDIQQDMEEITEDVDEEKRKQRQAAMLETLTNDVKVMLRHIESLKVR